MRRLEIIDDIELSFPGRDASFESGVEIGALAVLMAQGEAMLCRRLTANGVETLRPLAEQFFYSLIATPTGDGMVDISLIHRRYRSAKLRVV